MTWSGSNWHQGIDCEIVHGLWTGPNLGNCYRTEPQNRWKLQTLFIFPISKCSEVPSRKKEMRIVHFYSSRKKRAFVLLLTMTTFPSEAQIWQIGIDLNVSLVLLTDSLRLIILNDLFINSSSLENNNLFWAVFKSYSPNIEDVSTKKRSSLFSFTSL